MHQCRVSRYRLTWILRYESVAFFWEACKRIGDTSRVNIRWQVAGHLRTRIMHVLEEGARASARACFASNKTRRK